MNLKKTAILLYAFVAISAYSQTNKVWNTVSIKNVCSFKLPPTMELQGSGYRKMMDSFQKTLCYIMEYSYDKKRVVAQPKGINKLDKKALKHYSRFIVETFSLSSTESMPKLSDSLTFTKEELAQMNTGFKQGILEDFALAKRKTGIAMTMLKWYPLKITKIQNVDSLEYGFLRKSSVKGKAPVDVKYYILFNRTHGHKVTVSYRTDEKELWDNTLRTMLSTLSFKEK